MITSYEWERNLAVEEINVVFTSKKAVVSSKGMYHETIELSVPFFWIKIAISIRKVYQLTRKT